MFPFHHRNIPRTLLSSQLALPTGDAEDLHRMRQATLRLDEAPTQTDAQICIGAMCTDLYKFIGEYQSGEVTESNNARESRRTGGIRYRYLSGVGEEILLEAGESKVTSLQRVCMEHAPADLGVRLKRKCG